MAQSVVDNLQQRFDNVSIEEVRGIHNYHYEYDFGLLPSPEKKFIFQIRDLILTCWFHDWQEFRMAVDKRLRDKTRHINSYNRKFYKLHSHSHILCLTNQQRDHLLIEFDASFSENNKMYESWNNSLLKKRG